MGFYKDLDVLYAVVEQPFVKANEKTDLNAFNEPDLLPWLFSQKLAGKK